MNLEFSGVKKRKLNTGLLIHWYDFWSEGVEKLWNRNFKVVVGLVKGD